jgi:protein-disulfide isomerase
MFLSKHFYMAARPSLLMGEEEHKEHVKEHEHAGHAQHQEAHSPHAAHHNADVKETVVRTKKKEADPKSERVENVVAVSVFALLLLVIVVLFTNAFGFYDPNPFPGGRVQVPYDNTEPVRGNTSQPRIVITIFTEFECPFCKKGEETVMEVFREYEDTTVLVFKHFPLTSIHPNAFNASLAAECAHEQGMFWEYHDILFARNDALTVPDLKSYANELGLDREKFDYCLESGKYSFKVLSDTKTGRDIGVSSTPTFFINGLPVLGAQPIDEFEDIISEELKRPTS